MTIRRSTFKRPLIALAMVAVSCIAAIAQQPPTPSRVRGTIEAVDGDVLSVKSRSGEDFKLHMTADMRVVDIIKIALSDIKVGSFVGTTTVPGPDGIPTAVEVHVFSRGHARHRGGLQALRSQAELDHDQCHRRRERRRQ